MWGGRRRAGQMGGWTDGQRGRYTGAWKDGLGWVVGQREPANPGPNSVLSGGQEDSDCLHLENTRRERVATKLISYHQGN